MATPSAVVILWIPVGAEGSGFVRFNGRVYEAIAAWRGRRPRLALVHSALVVHVGEERYAIENAPRPDNHSASRGVAGVGPVWARWLGRLPAFRYETRCWRDGAILDACEAIGGPVVVSGDAAVARAIVDLVSQVPLLTWGRRPAGASEMWNSNSVIAWLLTRAGVEHADARLPRGTRAPGWRTGVEVALRG